MTDYTKATNFASKDSLASGNPLKIVKGTEINTEFDNIATAVATKADLNSPTFIGTPLAPTASAGTSTTQVATTAFVDTSYAKKGSNSDITALSGLTTALSVGQGGTGATSITSGSLVKGNGTSAFSAASASDIVTAIGSTAVTNATNSTNCTTALGYSQSWTDVTSSRALSFTYTNNTGKPIMLVVNATRGGASTSTLNISVNGGSSFQFAVNTNSGGGNSCSGSIVIPNGQTYNVSSPDSSLVSWWELR